jgi:hypothetical protein
VPGSDRNPALGDDCVVLRSGLALPVEPIKLALELEERGFRLAREGEDTLVVRPNRGLTDEDHRRVRRWKPHLLALLEDESPDRPQ